MFPQAYPFSNDVLYIWIHVVDPCVDLLESDSVGNLSWPEAQSIDNDAAHCCDYCKELPL